MTTTFIFEKSNLEEVKNFVRNISNSTGRWNDSDEFIVEDEEDATDFAHEFTIEGFEFEAID